MKNTKRIEESATTALKSALLKCPILDAYIDSNDKTPSWDGTVFVYKSEDQKKENIKGRVPIQVKGTEKNKRGLATRRPLLPAATPSKSAGIITPTGYRREASTSPSTV